LRWTLAPPALGGGASLSLVQVLSSAGVPCLQLVVPRGESLGTLSDRAVRPVAFRHFVLLLGGPASGPSLGFHPLLLRNLPLEVCKRSRKGHGAYLRPVCVVQPFHPAGVWLLRRNLCPFVGLFVSSDTFVGRAPPDSMVIPGRARRSVAMCFLAWSAYCWPGPGSSVAIRLMAVEKSPNQHRIRE